jgi:hypothetical protein
MQTTASSSTTYPASFTFQPAEKVANWRAIGNPIMAIPHFVVMYALGVVSNIVSIISWFAILFTGRLPAGLANFHTMYLRYQLRTVSFAAFMREEYPPFAFDMATMDPGGDSRLRVDVRPQLENRNRLTTAFRLILAIPQLIVLAVLAVAAMVCVVIAFFAVLFTGRWPGGLQKFVLGVARWNLRTNAYLLLLTDTYPPFSLD